MYIHVEITRPINRTQKHCASMCASFEKYNVRAAKLALAAPHALNNQINNYGAYIAAYLHESREGKKERDGATYYTLRVY